MKVRWNGQRERHGRLFDHETPAEWPARTTWPVMDYTIFFPSSNIGSSTRHWREDMRQHSWVGNNSLPQLFLVSAAAIVQSLASPSLISSCLAGGGHHPSGVVIRAKQKNRIPGSGPETG